MGSVNAPTIGAGIHVPLGGTTHTGNGCREAGRLGIVQLGETERVDVDDSGRLQVARIHNRAPVEGGA